MTDEVDEISNQEFDKFERSLKDKEDSSWNSLSGELWSAAFVKQNLIIM